MSTSIMQLRTVRWSMPMLASAFLSACGSPSGQELFQEQQRTPSGGSGNTGGTTGTGGSSATGGSSTGSGGNSANGVCAGSTWALDGRSYGFEDGLAPDEWYFAQDGSCTLWAGDGESVVVLAGGANDSAYAARAAGNGCTDWGVVLGIGLGCADVSGLSGLTFWARTGQGSGETVRFQAGTPETLPTDYGGDCVEGCWNRFVKTFELTTEWKQYTLVWSELAQDPTWGTQVQWSGIVQTLEWGTGTESNFDFWVDSVTFTAP